MESVEGIVAGYDVGVFAGDGAGGDGGGKLESAGSVVGGLLESNVGEFLDRSSDILVEGCLAQKTNACSSFFSTRSMMSTSVSAVNLDTNVQKLGISSTSASSGKAENKRMSLPENTVIRITIPPGPFWAANLRATLKSGVAELIPDQ